MILHLSHDTRANVKFTFPYMTIFILEVSAQSNLSNFSAISKATKTAQDVLLSDLRWAYWVRFPTFSWLPKSWALIRGRDDDDIWWRWWILMHILLIVILIYSNKIRIVLCLYNTVIFFSHSLYFHFNVQSYIKSSLIHCYFISLPFPDNIGCCYSAAFCLQIGCLFDVTHFSSFHFLSNIFFLLKRGSTHGILFRSSSYMLSLIIYITA